MRKTQVALAALALVASTAAMADGVKVSGILDAGVQNSTGNGTYIASGLLAPNFINFAGSEDLGNGMKAEFFLQTRLELVDGAKTTDLWNQSYIGLVTEAGTLQVGRNVDSFSNAVLASDVTVGGNMGSYVDSVLFLGSSAVFANNQIKYISPNVGGLNVMASGYMMEDSDQKTAKNDYSLAGIYSNGAISASAAYANRKYTGNEVKAWHVSAGYDFGFAKVNLVYQDTNGNGSVTGVNAAVPVASIAGLTATIGYYNNNNTASSDGSTTSVGAKYALSKRSTLFANYQNATDSYTLNKGLSQTTGITAGAGNAVTLGVSHSF